MKLTLTRLLIISGSLAVGSSSIVAQEKKPATGKSTITLRRVAEKVTWQSDTFKVLSAKFGHSKVVKGAPYSATATTEHIQTLSDGNQIIRKNESKVYRDSEGRTRIEQTLETIGKWTTDGKATQRIFINDPVGAMSYSLDPRNATRIISLSLARKKGEVIKIVDETKPGRPVLRDEAEKVAQVMGEVEALEKKRTALLERVDINVGQKKTESLGNHTIGGVTAEGTRSTVTIPAGEIGNTQPLEIVDETWYSPELQIIVMTKHRDPRTGETTYRLTDINRNEPDRSLFQVPARYNVRERKVSRKPKPTK